MSNVIIKCKCSCIAKKKVPKVNHGILQKGTAANKSKVIQSTNELNRKFSQRRNTNDPLLFEKSVEQLPGKINPSYPNRNGCHKG